MSWCCRSPALPPALFLAGAEDLQLAQLPCPCRCWCLGSPARPRWPMDLLPALCPYRPVVPAAWDLLQLPCLLPALPVSICRAVVLQGFPKKDSCCPRRWAASRFWAGPPPPVAKKGMACSALPYILQFSQPLNPSKGLGLVTH